MSTYADPYASASSGTGTTQLSAGGLSHGVIAGLAILGAAVVALIFTISYGYWIRRLERLRPRSHDTRAVGLEWKEISYTVRVNVSSQRGRRWASTLPLRGTGFRRQEEGDVERQEQELQNEQKASSNSSQSTAPLVSAAGENKILREVSSLALPGSLNFILGPSGAGKSSLVDILAGRAKSGRVQGSLSTLHTQEKLESGRTHTSSGHLVALVDQDDSVCLPGYMTVHEMLSFAAELSLPENTTNAERLKVVDNTIEILGLTNVAHSRIGDARTRGISGGERRRVSLGVALVGQPKILIADECTSGLDAFSAYRVIKALRQLACGEQDGITVIATLHQPSSQIFALADNIMLLSHGRILFDGKPSQALSFCHDQGVDIPAGHNVADHLLTYAFDKQHLGDRVETAASNLAISPGDGERTRDQVSTRPAGSQDEKGKSIQQSTGEPDAILCRETLPLKHGGGSPTTTFMTQLHALLKRALIMTRRDHLGAMAHIGGAAVVSVFVGACFFQVKLNLGGFQNRVGSMFFIFIMILFMDLTALVGLANVRLLMMRERANSLYSPWSWVTSHLAFDLILLRAIPVIIIVSIVYWMVGLNHHASNFFLFMLIAILFSWTIAIYNMTISALVEDMGTTILLTSLFVLFNIFMAGFLMSLDSMPAAVRWLRWIAPAKYALEAVASNELKNLKFEDTFAGVPISTDVSLFANKLFGFQDGSYYRDLIVLACGFLVGFGILLFSSVWWRMRELR